MSIVFQSDLFDEHQPIPRFRGTRNPRHLRALSSFMRGSIDREVLDERAGCRNAPELVAELRRRGLELPCHRNFNVDRDGRVCRTGTYYLTSMDRMLIEEWLRRTGMKI